MRSFVSNWTMVLACLTSTFTAVAFASHAGAHDLIPGRPQTRPIVIENATLHLGNGSVMPDACIRLEDGVIVEVDREVELPEQAIVIDGEGKHVYPGLIDSYTDLGLREITAVDVTIDNVELGSRNPNVRSWVAFNPDSELIPVGRANGVMVAHVVPGGRFMQGQSGVLQLDGWSAEDMLIAGPTGLCVNWESVVPRGSDSKANAKRYNEQIVELDDLLDQTKRYGEAIAADPNTPTDVRLESLLPVVSGQRPVFVQADRQATIESAIAFFTSRRIPMVLCGGADAMRCVDSLTAHDIPVILIATYRVPRRRHDAYDAIYTLPSELHEAGVRFAIAGEGSGYPGGASNLRNLAYHAGVAVAYGLPREQAVRAITGSAAELLGVADRVGTLTVQHDATLIITDGDVLEPETQVVDAYVQGRRVDLNSKHTQLFKKYQQKR